MKTIVLLGLCTLVSLTNAKVRLPKFGAEMVDFINKDNTIPFQAKRYSRFEGKSKEDLKCFLGMLPDPNIEREKDIAASRSKRQVASTATAPGLPLNFTIDQKWPLCAVVFNGIRNQANCGSCWAVSSASVMTDRRCIAIDVPKNQITCRQISSWDLVGCCSACQGTQGNGCQGGYPTEAFKYFDQTGVVTGGDYGNTATCKPYPVSPSAASMPTSTSCAQTCQTSYTTAAYAADKKKGSAYQVFSNNNTAVMQNIYTYGSVVATYAVYEDFYQYSSGVYQHATGQLVGYHAVRVVGWGQTASGTPYWRVANSWGTSWGMNGFFHIVRGTNNCGFEAGIVTGTVVNAA